MLCSDETQQVEPSPTSQHKHTLKHGTMVDAVFLCGQEFTATVAQVRYSRRAKRLHDYRVGTVSGLSMIVGNDTPQQVPTGGWSAPMLIGA